MHDARDALDSTSLSTPTSSLFPCPSLSAAALPLSPSSNSYSTRVSPNKTLLSLSNPTTTPKNSLSLLSLSSLKKKKFLRRRGLRQMDRGRRGTSGAHPLLRLRRGAETPLRLGQRRDPAWRAHRFVPRRPLRRGSDKALQLGRRVQRRREALPDLGHLPGASVTADHCDEGAFRRHPRRDRRRRELSFLNHLFLRFFFKLRFSSLLLSLLLSLSRIIFFSSSRILSSK